MPNKKISQLVNKTIILSTDLFPIGDATSGQLYKKTIAELQAAIGGAVISVNGLVGTVVLDTDDIQELVSPTNKWFTDARARGAVSATSPLAYNSSTGVFSIPAATTSANGYLTSTDWNTFNGKENVLTFSSPLVRTSNTISMPAATTSVSGYLTSTDWNTFNNKQGALTLTTTGSSGSATLASNTLNIPTYTLAGLGGITASFLSGGTGITYNSGTGVIATTITQYTDALARASLSFTAGSGAYNSTTGVITIPTNTSQLTNGANFITLASLSGGTGISYNNTTGVITNTITQYTDALARGAISLTVTGSSGASTYNSTTGVLNVPTYTLSGLGGQPALSGTGFIKISGTTISYDNSTYLTTASAASTYQTIITNPVTGTGTTNYIPKWTSSSALGNSLIYDNGTNVGIGITNPNAGRLQINVNDTTTVAHFQVVDGTTTLANSFITNFRNANDGNGRYSLSSWQVQNAVGNDQNAFIGVQSVSGSGVYTPNLIFGQKTAASSYTTRMTLDTSGNLGLGVTPSAWGAGTKALQISDVSFWGLSTLDGYASIGGNYFYNGNYVYIKTGQATDYYQYQGAHAWRTAASGTAGTTISFTQAMTLDASGNLMVGATSNSQGAKLKISGGYIYINETSGADVYLRSAYDGNKAAIQVASANDLVLVTSNTSRVTLFSNGNLALVNGSATDSGYRLDVTGKARFINTGGVPALDIRASDANFALMGILGNQTGDVSWLLMSGYPSAGDFTIRQSDTVNALTLKKTTGAATFSSSVNATKFVAGSGANQAILDAGVLYFYNAASSAKYISLIDDASSIAAIGFSKSGSIATSWFPSGSVGIGTSSPSSMLTLNGTSPFIRIERSGVNTWQIQNNYLVNQNGFSINNITAGTTPFFIGENGNIGISTASPSVKLQVDNNTHNYFQLNSTVANVQTSISAQNTSSSNRASLSWEDGTRGAFADLYSSTYLSFTTQSSEKGRITAGGNWLLGTTTDNGERLYISGNVRATGTITANSDIRLKKNLERIENALEKVGQISGYTYNTIYDDKRHGGVIAQEIDDVFPEIVNKGNDGLLGVEYGNISALLIEALKELKEKNTALEARLQALEK